MSDILKKAGMLVIYPVAKAVEGVDKLTKEVTGERLTTRLGERIAAEEKEREEKPLKWAGKKLLKGMAKGFFGVYRDSR